LYMDSFFAEWQEPQVSVNKKVFQAYLQLTDGFSIFSSFCEIFKLAYSFIGLQRLSALWAVRPQK